LIGRTLPLPVAVGNEVSPLQAARLSATMLAINNKKRLIQST
jgi:hypothetical protein